MQNQNTISNLNLSLYLNHDPISAKFKHNFIFKKIEKEPQVEKPRTFTLNEMAKEIAEQGEELAKLNKIFTKLNADEKLTMAELAILEKLNNKHQQSEGANNEAVIVQKEAQLLSLNINKRLEIYNAMNKLFDDKNHQFTIDEANTIMARKEFVTSAKKKIEKFTKENLTSLKKYIG